MPASDLTAEIEARNEGFMRAAGRGDAAALAALYSDDAWLLPPGAHMLRGRVAIQAFWADRLPRIGAIALTTVDVVPVGEDGAREVASSLITIKGQDQPVAGKYVVLWTRIGGVLHLEADMWNANG